MRKALSQRRRVWLCALAAAVAVTAAFAAPAWAGFVSPSSITADSDIHWWSTPNVVSNGTYQWIGYWDAPDAEGRVYVQVTRRRLSDNRVDTIRFDGTGGTEAQSLRNINDAHDYVQLGLSPNDGRMHISWSSHHATHHYARSAERCLTEATFSQATCRFDWREFQTEQRDVDTFSRRSVFAEQVFTYPYYFNDSRGRLYMSYRFGESSRGNQYLNSYDEGTGRWTSRGLVLWGRRGAATVEFDVPDDGDAGTPDPATSSDRGVYPWGWQFDKNDRLHLAWIWKEHLESNGNPDYPHGLNYAYSLDYGRTWRTSNGEALGTSDTEPITVLDEEASNVFEVPIGSWPNGAILKLDSHNRPHLVFAMLEGELLASPFDGDSRGRHVWQGTDDRWHSSWIGAAGDPPSWGELMFDRADKAYYLYNKDFIGWHPWFSDPWRQTQLTSDDFTWQSDGERAGHVNVQVKSSITCMDTTDRIDTAISREGSSEVRARVNNNTDATQMEVWFTTSEAPDWTAENRVTATVTENDRERYREYNIDFSRHADWRGTLRQLEICMLDARADARDEFNLDWVRVTDNRGRATKSWEFNDVGTQLHLAEVEAINNWGEAWSDAALLPEVSDVRTDNTFWFDQQRYRETGNVTFPMIVQGVPKRETMTLREFRVTGDTVAKQWRFDLDEMEWTAANHVERLGWASDSGVGTLEGRMTGNDSAVDSPANLGVKLGGRTVEVRMKQSAGTQAMLCWTTNASRTWNINRCSRPFEVRADGRHNTYRVRTEGWRDWESRQTLYQLRLEPSDTREVTSGTFNVDVIKIVD